MPQVLIDRPPKTSEEEEGRFLKLTFRLNKDPDLAVMNELALNLQYLPHVDQIKFEDLYAPREQLTSFMTAVMRAQKIKPLIRKLQARRKRQELKTGGNGANAPESFLKLHLEQNHHSVCDWSRTERVHGHKPKSHDDSRDGRKKTSTWPPAQRKSDTSSGDQLLAEYKVDGPGTVVAKFVPRRVHTMDAQAHEQANGEFHAYSYFLKMRAIVLISQAGITESAEADRSPSRDGRKRQRSTSPNGDIPPSKRGH